MLQSIQIINIVMIHLHPIPHILVVVAAMVVVAVAMRADNKVVEVVVTTTAIIVAIEIRKSTRTLLTISVTVFLLTKMDKDRNKEDRVGMQIANPDLVIQT
jgi:dTDP-4-dehydrorhamnose 3,5-epimerase-like enzyme